MKLFYKSGACSLSPHIVLHELGGAFTTEAVDTKTKVMASGGDFFKVNPKGYVPALLLDDGNLITEGAVIVQYLADQAPEKGLAPKNGTLARVRLQEHLNHIAAELHKAFTPLFTPGASDDVKAFGKARVEKALKHYEGLFADGRAYLMGESFSVADAYLFTVANWCNFVGIALADYPQLSAFMARMAARPAVQAALKAEGLLKAS
jgi:glutathione S-transferase